MSDLTRTLEAISAARKRDPLAPVTVVVPSHAVALQQRRRLGRLGPFASVRFETLPRLAELVAGPQLAAEGRRPLARPIGDYAAREVAQAAGPPFSLVADLPGFGRVLRQAFLRLRRGGVRTGREVEAEPGSALAETLRLYAAFRERTSDFYDPEDLLDAAAAGARARRAHRDALGAVYLVPPAPATAAGRALLEALAPVTFVADAVTPAMGVAEAFVLAPDPASEVRQAVKRVLALLESGAALDDVAVFHGAGGVYHQALAEAFAAASVPLAAVPGAPLSRTPAGQAALLIAGVALGDYTRADVADLLGSPTLPEALPGPAGPVPVRASRWDAVSRRAGVTGGADGWHDGLQRFIASSRAGAAAAKPEEEARARRLEWDAESAEELDAVLAGIVPLLEPLRTNQPAAAFIARFAAAFTTLVRTDAEGADEVLREIQQLGTVDALGGTFSLASFEAALRANLDSAALRRGALSDGVFVAPYAVAAGLQFRHVVLCGAAEGQFPAGPGAPPLLSDGDWLTLSRQFPSMEHAALRRAAGDEAAARAVAAASETLTWSSPLHDALGVHDIFPSSAMASRAALQAASVTSPRQLRDHPPTDWLFRPPSPFAATMEGAAVDAAEAGLRRAVALATAGVPPPADHPRAASLRLLRARREAGFSEFDGNLRPLAGGGLPLLHRTLSPTTLETYAACGYRYFLGSVLHLRAVDSPEERDTIEPKDRGTVAHDVLERFFRLQKARGRPQPRERWTATDRDELLQIAEEVLESARAEGRTGLEVFLDHERRSICYELEQFLEADNAFRESTGAVPELFEHAIPAVEIAGFTFRGKVDRIDRDGHGRAWVVDYKTGRPSRPVADDPLQGGKKLQLPAYLPGAEAAEAVGIYWHISTKWNFEQVEYRDSPENRRRFEATLGAIVQGIDAGVFPAVPGEAREFFNTWENCGFCDFSRICLRTREETQESRLGQADAAPWSAIATVARGGVS